MYHGSMNWLIKMKLDVCSHESILQKFEKKKQDNIIVVVIVIIIIIIIIIIITCIIAFVYGMF